VERQLVTALVPACVDDALSSSEPVEDLAEHLPALVLHRRHTEVVPEHPEQSTQQLRVVCWQAAEPEVPLAVPQVVRNRSNRVGNGVGHDIARVDVDPAMWIIRQHRSGIDQCLNTRRVDRGQPIGFIGEICRAPRSGPGHRLSEMVAHAWSPCVLVWASAQ